MIQVVVKKIVEMLEGYTLFAVNDDGVDLLSLSNYNYDQFLPDEKFTIHVYRNDVGVGWIEIDPTYEKPLILDNSHHVIIEEVIEELHLILNGGQL